MGAARGYTASQAGSYGSARVAQHRWRPVPPFSRLACQCQHCRRWSRCAAAVWFDRASQPSHRLWQHVIVPLTASCSRIFPAVASGGLLRCCSGHHHHDCDSEPSSLALEWRHSRREWRLARCQTQTLLILACVTFTSPRASLSTVFHNSGIQSRLASGVGRPHGESRSADPCGQMLNSRVIT